MRPHRKLTAAMWAGGILIAVVLVANAAVWLELAKVGGGLGQLGAHLSHIERLLSR
jgi:hypothetical protein